MKLAVAAFAGVIACAKPPPPPPPAPPTLCNAACWTRLHEFLADTCSCKTEDCLTVVSKQMTAWVTNNVIEPQHLTPRQSEIDLVAELQPYFAEQGVCEAQVPKEPRKVQMPTVEPLPPPMGIAACDQILARVTACSLLSAKAKVFARTIWDIEHDKLDKGDRATVESECAEEAHTWDDRFARDLLGC
jgi:hypothetical protein